ncbi:MAG: class I SAM-dependent methyltransferase [Chloroflexota bacterium]
MTNGGHARTFDILAPLLEKALASRGTLMDSRHETAFRLFNGFAEGWPGLALDIYGRTLVVHDHADDPLQSQPHIQEATTFLQNSLPWLRAGIVKTRNAKSQQDQRGRLVFGNKPDQKVIEHGVWYALDLTLNRDASLYLDTRNLRKWLIENMRGRTVLNTFAYTGSLGAAALAGGASRVVQQDRSRKFLNLAKTTYTLNGFPIHKEDFIADDFFPTVGGLRHAKQAFDCVILDPPFFSATDRGRVDQVRESARLINKVRPLVNDGGSLIAVNNALFVSGREYMRTLEELCEDGYLKIRELISIPDDFVGYHQIDESITDPTPFNHSTKIAVLDVKRKTIS